MAVVEFRGVKLAVLVSRESEHVLRNRNHGEVTEIDLFVSNLGFERGTIEARAAAMRSEVPVLKPRPF